MSDRAAGFIYLHRRLRDWPLWQAWSCAHRAVWMEMLWEAAYRPREVWTMQGRALLHRGEFVTSQVQLAALAKVSRKVVRSVYASLLAEGAIEQRVLGNAPGRGGAHQIVATTIKNYSRYQDKPAPRGHQKATKGPHQKKGKEGRKEAFLPDRHPSTPSFPPMNEGRERAQDQVVDVEEWRRRREAQLTAIYGEK